MWRKTSYTTQHLAAILGNNFVGSIKNKKNCTQAPAQWERPEGWNICACFFLHWQWLKIQSKINSCTFLFWKPSSFSSFKHFTGFMIPILKWECAVVINIELTMIINMKINSWYDVTVQCITLGLWHFELWYWKLHVWTWIFPKVKFKQFSTLFYMQYQFFIALNQV